MMFAICISPRLMRVSASWSFQFLHVDNGSNDSESKKKIKNC